jgi:hypothetical protein
VIPTNLEDLEICDEIDLGDPIEDYEKGNL